MKRRYGSRQLAEDAIQGPALFAHMGHKNRYPIRAYECPRCGGFHLTSQLSLHATA